ncbi:MAG: TolC family protein [Chthoniobacterales bacterium]
MKTHVSLPVAFIVLAFVATTARALTLDATLARVLEKNPAIREAQANLEQAAGRRVVLRATALPDLRTLVPAGVQGGKRAGENSVQPFAFARGLFTQPLFDLAIPASYHRGNIEVLLAEQRLNIAIIGQLHTARVAYYTAAYHHSLQALGEAQRQRLAANARTQSDRYEAGSSDRQAVTVARVLEQEVSPRVEESRRAESGALLTLARSMGDDIGSTAQLPTVEGELSFAPFHFNAEAESSAAIERRADLKLARLMVRAAAEDQRIIEAAYFPAIDATLSGDYIPVSDIRRGSEGSARPSDDIISSEARFGIAYTWQVVDNGKVSGAVTQRRAAREINEIVLAKLEADVPRQLAQMENNLHSLDARETALVRASAVSEKTVGDVVSNLAEGRSSQLEYRTAETSFLQAKAGLLAIAFQQNLARAEIDRVTGRYFQFSDDTGGKLH